VFAAAFTIFLETYQIAFSNGGMTQAKGTQILEYALLAVFVVDIFINFNLAYIDERDKVVYKHRAIAKKYLKGMFWFDMIGVFPFYPVALAISGEMGQNTSLSQSLAILRLFKMIRLRRVKDLFDILKYSTKISLMGLTLTRNFSAALVWTHLWACIMYFCARQFKFDPDNTWLGSQISGLNDFQRYTTSLYWSVVTFTTVGYGDFSPVNSAEQILGMLYMLLNVVLMSWMIGSITLLIVKSDEKTGFYRQTLHVLDKYATIHNFDKKLTKRLRKQLKLDFHYREITDEQVLGFFPISVRRKILRRLYLPLMLETGLMKGIQQEFVDAFLSLCTIEVYSSGEEILQRGCTSSDLYLLLDGKVEVVASSDSDTTVDALDGLTNFGTSIADSELLHMDPINARIINSGDFINELGFFTESSQIDTICTVTVCKMLTMSRSSYMSIAAGHPHSAGIILSNLLSKVEDIASAINSEQHIKLPKELAMLRACSSCFGLSFVSDVSDAKTVVAEAQARAAMTAVQDHIKAHINKQKDDHTTRFCFAASRGDIQTISVMCDHNFDPNSSDYDRRTALMVAAMNGQEEAVAKLLEYNADPNLIDMHGSSALYEATKSGQDNIVEMLLKHGAILTFDESRAASNLCQVVFNGDIPMLKRLIQARINVNSSNYDNRTPSHVAASEGHLLALKILIEAGADQSLKDRWGNTIRSEAETANTLHVLEYLDTL